MSKDTIFNVLWPIVKWEGYGKIVEVGVDTGYTSRLMLKRLDLDYYFLVDPWKCYEGEGAGTLARLNQIQWDAKYQEMIKLASQDKRVKVIRKESVEAAQGFAYGSLDMVFIDANHDYKNCYQDIRNWLPKIRQGGMLCGHDYSRHFPGVKEAVDKLIDKPNILYGSIWATKIE